MVFCLYGIFKSNLCLPRCFFRCVHLLWLPTTAVKILRYSQATVRSHINTARPLPSSNYRHRAKLRSWHQTKISSKQRDSHVHITVKSHTCLSVGSRLHSILQPPWLTAVFRSSSPSNLCLSLSDLCTSSLCLSKLTPQTCF